MMPPPRRLTTCRWLDGQFSSGSRLVPEQPAARQLMQRGLSSSESIISAGEVAGVLLLHTAAHCQCSKPASAPAATLEVPQLLPCNSSAHHAAYRHLLHALP